MSDDLITELSRGADELRKVVFSELSIMLLDYSRHIVYTLGSGKRPCFSVFYAYAGIDPTKAGRRVSIGSQGRDWW
jgi:hypothetical protein